MATSASPDSTSPGRWPPSLLGVHSDERLVALTRLGDHAAFDVLVARYQGRLLRFCQHLLRSRDDAEDVLQDVFTAAFVAMCADERPITVRPWLYRIARNRCLNHLRRTKWLALDSLEQQRADHGLTAADHAHRRDRFRLLVQDIKDLPDTQRRVLLMREMDALSYEQIAQAVDKTVSSVKSLLVRARWALEQAAEARALSCEEARAELRLRAEGGGKLATAVVRRHLRTCQRCTAAPTHADGTRTPAAIRRLAALLPIGLLGRLKRLVLEHPGPSTGAGSATAAGAGSAGPAVIGSSAGALLTGSGAAVAGKAAAGIAAAVLGAAGAVLVGDSTSSRQAAGPRTTTLASVSGGTAGSRPRVYSVPGRPLRSSQLRPAASTASAPVTTPQTTTAAMATPRTSPASAAPPGRTDKQTDTTTLPGRTSPILTSAAADRPGSRPTATTTASAPSGSTQSPTATTELAPDPATTPTIPTAPAPGP